MTREPHVSTLDFDLKRRPDMSTLRVDIVDGHELAGFRTVPWKSVTDYERARGIARHMQDVRPGTVGENRPSGCLRTGDDWRTWEKRFSSVKGRRVRTANDALVTELVAGHKEGLWSLPVLASKLSVVDKLTWLSGLGYGAFTRAQWDHMSKRDRRVRVLDNADMNLLESVVEGVLDMDGDAA